MRSILRQLKKYQPKPREPEPEEVSSEMQLGSDNWAEECAKELKISEAEINKIAISTLADTLYPKELEVIYNLVRKGRYIEDVEKKCDLLLQDFIRGQNPNQYLQIFKQAMTIRTKRLTMARVLLASFRFSNKPEDNVLAQYKIQASKFLGVQGKISQELAHRILERESASAGIYEQILGRIGYILVWKDLSKDAVISEILELGHSS